MKKVLSILTVSIALLSSCGGGGDNKQKEGAGAVEGEKKQVNDLQKERLSGDVVSVRQRVYWALEKFGRMDKGKLQNMPTQDYLKRYDKDGYLIEQIYYDMNEKIVNSKKIEYGKSHRIDKEQFYKGEVLDEYIVYTYDDNNRLIKKERFGGSGQMKEWNTYTYYPETGLLQDEDLYKASGDRVTKFVHIYEDSKLSERQKYWGGGTLAQKEFFSYDGPSGEFSEVIVEKYNNKQASFVSHTKYEGYNSFGDYTLKTEYNDQGEEKSTTSYSYDSYGNLTELVTTTFTTVSNDVAAAQAAVAVDSVGGDDEGYSEVDDDAPATPGVTEQRSGNAYTYEYDNQKNWTQKITYKVTNDEKARQFYYDRVITYK